MVVRNLAGVSSNDVGSVFGSRGYSSLDYHGSRELMDFDKDGDDWAAYIFIANRNGQDICMQAGFEPSPVKIDQFSIIVTWLEMLMFFASCVAAYRHFKDAGSRIRFSISLSHTFMFPMLRRLKFALISCSFNPSTVCLALVGPPMLQLGDPIFYSARDLQWGVSKIDHRAFKLI